MRGLVPWVMTLPCTNSAGKRRGPVTPYDGSDGQNVMILLVTVGLPIRISTVCSQYVWMQNVRFLSRNEMFSLDFCDFE